MAITLGHRVRDSITGFEGIATARVTYMYGCARILIEPTRLDSDGKRLEDVYFDEQRVEHVEDREISVSPQNSATSGGPQRDPPRR